MQIFFCGGYGKCNGSLYVLSFQGGKICQDFFCRIACSQTCQHRAQSNPRAFEDCLASADFGIADNSPFKIGQEKNSGSYLSENGHSENGRGERI